MAMPTMVSVDARLRDVGDTITVAYNVPGSDANEIAIVAEGADPDSAVERLRRVRRERHGRACDRVARARGL